LTITPIIHHKKIHTVAVVNGSDAVIVAGNLAIAMKKENVRFYGVSEIESGAKLHFLLNPYEEVHGTFWCSLHRVFPGVKQPLQYLRSIQCRNV
jgi:hypothetical protein